MDMTAVSEPPLARTAIRAGSSSSGIISDGRFTSPARGRQPAGIRLPSRIELVSFGNLVRLRHGHPQRHHLVVASSARSWTPGTSGWTRQRAARARLVPLSRLEPRVPRRQAAASRIESFDPETLRFQLQEPRETNIGDRFEVFAPSANWLIHDNIITGCRRPFVLDSYGSETTLVKDNIVTRGETTDARVAVELRGRFDLVGNHISGFDEKDATALALWPDRFGKPCGNLYRGNVIQRCFRAVAENAPGLWAVSTAEGNEFIACGGVPAAKQ